mmetsp:Transcript_39489/g.48088  ORF Transcript_39489/g.48088 Transcript_39489/m.48088 type:complete len:168 (-) Transcript_39489:17-520(-)
MPSTRMVKKTINSFGNKIGQRMSASEQDILQIRLLYQCFSGPRTLSEYTSNPCSDDCRCWKGFEGCLGRDSYCQGGLACVDNMCVDAPPSKPPTENPTEAPTTTKFPTDAPTTTRVPTESPKPTKTHTNSPTYEPTKVPAIAPIEKSTKTVSKGRRSSGENEPADEP